jgi:hypothetical protein
LCADEKHIRTQSAILDKSKPKPLLLLSKTVFLVRMVFIRTKNRVGARERAMAALGMRRNLRHRIQRGFIGNASTQDAPNPHTLGPA